MSYLYTLNACNYFQLVYNTFILLYVVFKIEINMYVVDCEKYIKHYLLFYAGFILFLKFNVFKGYICKPVRNVRVYLI